MTRKECFQILNDPSNPLYEELRHKFYTNRAICRRYYEEIGLYKTGMVLHHKIFNCTNYEDWKIDEIVPMTKEEHSKLHTSVFKQGIGSEESKKKAHEVLRKKYQSGELQPWNKGLTKETDSRIKESPRKGKTGDEFPFLRASKKGKPAWNKGISKDDPRYSSLKHTEQQKTEHSIKMKQRSDSGKNDAFIYSCKGTAAMSACGYIHQK